MTLITYGSLCKAVATALQATAGVVQVQGYDELTESISETPTLQVYFSTATTDDLGQVDRSTFGAGVRATRLDITIDCYARQSSHIAEDLAAQIDIIDAVDQVLASQVTAPFFGGAKALRWSWKKAILTSADASYAGAECTLSLWIF